jgi:hypothetical protein
LSSDEEILEAMAGPEKPWDDLQHRSYLLPELRRIEAREFVLTVNEDSPFPTNPLAMHRIYAKGNMERIATMIPIDISRTPGFMENVFVGAYCSPEEIRTYTKLFKELHEIFSWSYKDILDIVSRIVEHKITTYLDVKLV